MKKSTVLLLCSAFLGVLSSETIQASPANFTQYTYSGTLVIARVPATGRKVIGKGYIHAAPFHKQTVICCAIGLIPQGAAIKVRIGVGRIGEMTSQKNCVDFSLSHNSYNLPVWFTGLNLLSPTWSYCIAKPPR